MGSRLIPLGSTCSGLEIRSSPVSFLFLWIQLLCPIRYVYSPISHLFLEAHYLMCHCLLIFPLSWAFTVTQAHLPVMLFGSFPKTISCVSRSFLFTKLVLCTPPCTGVGVRSLGKRYSPHAVQRFALFPVKKRFMESNND